MLAHVKEAWDDVLAKRPVMVEREAAYKNPSRAVHMRELVKGMPAATLASLAKLAAKDQEGPAAWAIRQEAATLASGGQDATAATKELTAIGKEV
ncbi:MAG: hypothetical protein ACR2G6_12555 [Gemmatimonadaceae bacterium]|nr:hypothetical protein [Gemmatimonadota bacterium]